MSGSSTHIININRTSKNIKSDIIADFVYKIASPSDLNTIEKYIKNVNNIVLEDIIFLFFFYISTIYYIEHEGRLW